MVGYGVDAACGHAALDRNASIKTGTAIMLTLSGFIAFLLVRLRGDSARRFVGPGENQLISI
jgi:hypothetical protein